ncbi:dockerin type I domain-containing protein [bacterium]|nr:dockerin type I domain-containing protein [bacterium]
MTACTRDANKHSVPPPKGRFFRRPRWHGRRRQRPQLGFEYLERRFLLAGDISPTIDALPDLPLAEDADLQAISLSGIGVGAGIPDSLRISAVSQNELLVNSPNVIYQPGQPTGILELQLIPNANGDATIVVTVEDAGLDNDAATTADNGVTQVSFIVSVASVNDSPTVTQPPSVAFEMNAAASLVASSPTLTGRDYGDLHSGSIFTSSIDLTSDGNGMIVGASGGTDSSVGYVEVYHRTNELSRWIPIGQQLVGDAETVLGRTVSLNDNSTRIAFSIGRAVSIMELNQELNTWVSLGTPISTQGIVASVVLNSTGDLLAIATADSDGIPNAQVYRFDGVDWLLEQDSLTMGQDVSEDVDNQVSQSRVAMNSDGTRLIHSIAGCGCSGTGYAKVYERNAETAQWTALGNRIEGDGSYGSTTAISGDGLTVAVGAPQLGTETDLFGNGLVAVLRFDASSDQWLPLGNAIVGAANGQQLGAAVSLTEDATTLVIGSSGASTDLVNKAGKISIFKFDEQTSDWNLVQEHNGPDANASFGWQSAVSGSGSSVIAGARGSSSSTNKNGTLVSLSLGHTIPLSGITAGGDESQAVRISALTDETLVTGQPVINYTNGESRAELLFRPVLNHAGLAEIQVIVEDEGLDGDFATTGDNAVTTRTFSFGVGLSNFEQNAGRLSLGLGKASGDIRISKSDEGTTLALEGDRWIGIASEDILIPQENRMVLPDIRDFGRVELVMNGERNIVFEETATWRLGTPLIDGQRFLRGLTSLNDEAQIIYLDGGAPWQNPIEPSDIDASGHVSPVDALQIINELASNVFSNSLTGILADPLSIETWPNRNFDQDANGRISALDALRVINHLGTQQSNEGGEGETLARLTTHSSRQYSIPHHRAPLSGSLESLSGSLESLSGSLESLSGSLESLSGSLNPNAGISFDFTPDENPYLLGKDSQATERAETPNISPMAPTDSSMALAIDHVLQRWH